MVMPGLDFRCTCAHSLFLQIRPQAPLLDFKEVNEKVEKPAFKMIFLLHYLMRILWKMQKERSIIQGSISL